MYRFLALLLALAAAVSTPARADFAFPWDVEFDGGEFRAFVVLPDHFGLHFGLWDHSYALIDGQRQNPLPKDMTDTLRFVAQRWLWQWYVDQKILPQGFETDAKFRDFVFAESLFDGRSAFVFVSDRNDITKIHAMFRASSRVISDMKKPKGFRQYLPYELRGFAEPTFTNWWNQPRPTKIYYDLLEEPIFTFSGGPKRSIEGLLSHVNWFFGAQLELKNWAHKPQVVVDGTPGGKGRRRVRDFMPLLIRLARLHKILSWTGHTMDMVPLKNPALQKDLDFAIEMASRIEKRQLTAGDIGIRAGQYHVECIDDLAESRYRDDFGFERQFQYDDLMFRGKQTRVLFADREVFEQRLDAYATARPGATLLPATRIEFQGSLKADIANECARRLITTVEPAFFEIYDILALSLGEMGRKHRPMP